MDKLDTVKSYYVNLDRDKDRRKSTDKLLTSLDLNFEREPGLLFDEIPEDERQAVFPQEMLAKAKYDKKTAAELAVFYTHRQAWQKALKQGYEYVIVFEDDIVTYITKSRLQHILLNVIHHLDFDILYLGKCLDTCSRLEHKFGQIYRTYGPYCVHAYMLNRRMMEYLSNEPLSHTAIDNHFRNLIQDEIITAYTFHPSIFIQDVVRFTSNLRGKVSSLNNMSECQDLQDQWSTSNNRNSIILGIVIVVLAIIIIWLIWRRGGLF